MDSYPQPSFGRAVTRGAVRHCPRCGSGKLFRYWVSMVDDCPRCELHFEQTEGYWLGSMVINLAVAMGAVLLVFIGTMVVTWPDVPWNALTIAVVVVALVVPIVFHPISRTLWVAAERHIRARSGS